MARACPCIVYWGTGLSNDGSSTFCSASENINSNEDTNTSSYFYRPAAADGYTGSNQHSATSSSYSNRDAETTNSKTTDSKTTAYGSARATAHDPQVPILCRKLQM